MSGIPVMEQSAQRVGEEWINAIVEKDFQSLAEICQPEVRSRLMTPKRIDVFENVQDLIHKVEDWFSDCTSFQQEQTRFAMVGQKLAIFYRLSFEAEGIMRTAEQQLYCTLRDGLIDGVSLLCSGFQPPRAPVDAPKPQRIESVLAVDPLSSHLNPRADAFLKFETDGGRQSTCSILTPLIKRKLGEIGSGQVLKVDVDDLSAKDDIEAWCRLSGNSLLKMEQGSGQELSFFVMKK